MRSSTVANPFEDPDASYYVLVNEEGQHSLWPEFAMVPDGWIAVHGTDSREGCIEYINANWTDMRPLSLVRQMESESHS
jgi:MbtH protein